jgi:hypothetical protein
LCGGVRYRAYGPLRPVIACHCSQRGFCKVCGGNLFWRPEGEARTSIAAGTLDLPTHVSLAEHIFVADKGDYYEIDGPQRDQ